jgi:putative spermidine/putrescine transport system permease protein
VYRPAINSFRWFVTIIVVLSMILPSLIVIPLSFDNEQFIEFPPKALSWINYQTFFTTSAWTDAALHTIVISTASALLATVLGTLAAIGLQRTRFRGKSVLRAAFLVPMVMPTMVLALGLYQLFASLQLLGTLYGLAFAYTLLGMPVVMLNVSAGLQSTDQTLEQAARVLGANPVRAFVSVTLPSIRSSMLSGAIFAFIIAFDEVVIADFLSGTSAATLPLQMWLGLRFEINPVIPAAATLALLFALGIFLVGENLRRAYTRGPRRGVVG